ncbi:MAG TPA: phage tail protein I [Thermosulfurimonas dismutans]|uniref:Phage tail protein I n=1 Tax=Thermosulfurimonas dismutans TaxID=999894 RepID=A0A7C3CG54_9BACT|nr:phage tail protein I [Thermosulfurimonas dismutans]
MPNDGKLETLLPVSIAGDEKIKAAARACDSELAEIDRNINAVYILSRIDELPEPVLDLLAWQFHIEGYDLARTVEEKRALVKSAIELHRYKGTPWAVKQALSSLGFSADLDEWFRYAGQPYRFRVFIDLERSRTLLTSETLSQLKSLIRDYKNERSWLETIEGAIFASGGAYAVAGAAEETTITFMATAEKELLAEAIPALQGGTTIEITWG